MKRWGYVIGALYGSILELLVGGGAEARGRPLCRSWGAAGELEPTITAWHERPVPPPGLLHQLWN